MTDQHDPDAIAEFDARVTASMGALSPAEQRIARFFIEQKHAVLLGSAAQIAEKAGTSDATVVRTVKSLGFDGLASLREALLSDVSGVISPGGRLRHTLEETGDDTTRALNHVIGAHEDVLSVLKRDDFAQSFARAVALLGAAKCRHVFGIGPSGAMADYASLQFNRIGMPTRAMSESGITLADQLLWVNEGDAILMMAYAPLYREVSVVLDQAQGKGVPVVLISDTLGPLVGDKIADILPVPRGKAGHLAMHGGTMVLVEAMIIALASHNPEASLGHLDSLSTLRAAIDKDWSKRGTRKKAKKQQ
ncbi:DNA-binding MurR/RpiR family transcriptional regulator [Devosia sp. UYZn731]|uniref:MurR/RpiR family transcriptional regulator n=1 Tax=Devosia sp. UYZn731 TaxID=3156345 RepID=UPI00339A0694